MPIKIPDTLPAAEILRNEGVMLMTEADADRQDIRPLEKAIRRKTPQRIIC